MTPSRLAQLCCDVTETIATAFLAHLARLPIRDWLAVRDAVEGSVVGHNLFPAYDAALTAAREQGRTREVRTIEDEVRRLTGAIAWFAQVRAGNGEAITHRDLAALERLAERAAVGLLMREALREAQWRALYAPFARVLPLTPDHDVLPVPADNGLPRER